MRSFLGFVLSEEIITYPPTQNPLLLNELKSENRASIKSCQLLFDMGNDLVIYAFSLHPVLDESINKPLAKALTSERTNKKGN